MLFWFLPFSQWTPLRHNKTSSFLVCLVCYSGPAGERSIAISLSVCLCACVCLAASISLEPLDWSSRNSFCMSSLAVARSFCGGIAICYVLPFFWMTSRLALVGRMRCVSTTTSGVVIAGRSLMSMDALLILKFETDCSGYCLSWGYFFIVACANVFQKISWEWYAKCPYDIVAAGDPIQNTYLLQSCASPMILWVTSTH